MATTPTGGAAGVLAETWSIAEAVDKVAALLERTWVYFAPATTALCLRLLAYTETPTPTLYAVRTYVLRRRWNRRHIQQVLQFLEHNHRHCLIPAHILRTMLYQEYCALPNETDKAWIVGFLDPPPILWFGSAAPVDPNHVAAAMLLGPQAQCRNDEHLATFQELVRACK